MLTVRRPERYIGELPTAFAPATEPHGATPRRFLSSRAGDSTPMLEVELGAPLQLGRIARFRIRATTSLFASDLDRAATAMRAML